MHHISKISDNCKFHLAEIYVIAFQNHFAIYTVLFIETIILRELSIDKFRKISLITFI